MPKIDISKAELVWDGKYGEDGIRKEVLPVSLPFQVIETVNESRATREAKAGGDHGTLFDIYQGLEGDTFEEGWRNKLIWGDNLLAMGSLMEKFAGKINLIYIDPPFATGADFSINSKIGEGNEKIHKEQSAIEEKAYRDTWGGKNKIDSFIRMMYDRISLMHQLLSEDGSIYVHCDWRVNSYMRLILDEIFGVNNFRNEIIWHYKTYQGRVDGYFPKKHDNIFWYTKDKSVFASSNKFKLIYQNNYKDTVDFKRWGKFITETGQILFGNHPTTDVRFTAYLEKWIKENGRNPNINEVIYQCRGYVVDDVWIDCQALDPKDKTEKSGYPTQKPLTLLERIIKATSDEGELIADFFCGSGTTLIAAEKLGRRWIGCDLGRWGTHITRKRLLDIERCKPFELLNLGKYERQHWQTITLGKKKATSQQTVYEYLAFVLKLYKAEPISGMIHLHGRKGKALVHIGAVDSPVTISEINDAIDECIRSQVKELHILGWEWEMGLNNLIVKEAKEKGVKLALLQIPREVMDERAAEKGDVQFFELAYLNATVNQPKKLTAQLVLEKFVISNSDLIPDEVRDKVKTWSDYIDYWAVDWDFQNDTFMQGWVTYRTKKQRKLTLTSGEHTYDKPGKYCIKVKVVDIFGNDTSKTFDVKIK